MSSTIRTATALRALMPDTDPVTDKPDLDPVHLV